MRGWPLLADWHLLTACIIFAPFAHPAPQHGDEFANERNEIQLGRVHGSFKWAIWVNTSKNPRLKQVRAPPAPRQPPPGRCLPVSGLTSCEYHSASVGAVGACVDGCALGP